MNEIENAPPDPRFVVIVGDLHGNLPWALHVIDRADELFTRFGETQRIIIQLGDFGWCPVPENVELQQMDAALAERGIELWWIDGNHDYHPHIGRMVLEHQFDTEFPAGSVRLDGMGRIRYLPRGTRWTWAGRRWLAVGGAVSVDRLARHYGVNWWPEEQITDEQEDAIIAAGPADVLLSHDCPDSWFPWDRLGPPAEIWKSVLPFAREHSARLERIARAVGVKRVFHGHYHISHDTRTDSGVHVTGLNMDGGSDNYRVFDVERVCGDETV